MAVSSLENYESMAVMASAGWNKPWPLGAVLFGLLSIVLAVIGTFTGKVYGWKPYGSVGNLERAKNPAEYWLTLVVQYLGGAFLIWWFWDSAFPN